MRRIYRGYGASEAMNLLLIYLEEVRDFQDQLPQDIQMELAKGSAGAFANYPIYEACLNCCFSEV